MITIEKTAINIGDAIDMIMCEVFGLHSDFADSVQKFLHYKNPQYITAIPCSDSNSTFGNTGTIGTIKATNYTTGVIDGTINNITKASDITDETKLSNLMIGYENLYSGAIRTYKEFVEYALFIVGCNIPTPLRIGNPYNLTIGNDFTSIRYPNNTSVSIKVFTNKDSIKYSINITFHTTSVCDPYIRESDEYKSAIKKGWKVKEDFHKPIKKNI